MKITRKAVFVAGFCALSACLLLPSIGRSQQPPARRIPPGFSNINPNAPVLSNRGVSAPPPTVLTDMEKVNKRIADLEAKIVDQQRTIDSLSKTVYSKPRGYSKSFITFGSINSLSPKDGLSYWARDNK